ncbi:MAG: DUF1203 domain-containing protein [Pseudonocardiales bacterium]|nr:MAG: DUF1203 domain-containing protein [Pseudonocardiales bacterium]
MTIHIHALPPAELQRIREQGRDDHGNPFAVRLDDVGGAPLRCCLRDSRPGERIGLISYSPVGQPGPYDESGPVFVHAEDCGGYAGADRYPAEFRARPQVFRTYRSDGTISGGRMVSVDDDQEQAAAALLADPDVAVVHSRNVVYGCYMFAITRAADTEPACLA